MHIFFVFPDGQYIAVLGGRILHIFCLNCLLNIHDASIYFDSWGYFPDLVYLPDGNTFGFQMVPPLVHLLQSALDERRVFLAGSATAPIVHLLDNFSARGRQG